MYEVAEKEKLKFIQNGLKEYSSKRNYDFGPESRDCLLYTSDAADES